MGAILGIAQGSKKPHDWAKFLALSWRLFLRRLAFVGKGVTPDTAACSLKDNDQHARQ